MASYCFKQGCELEVQYVCYCLSSVTYCCEFHLELHLKLPNRTHSFDSILTEPSELTKDIILNFLEKEKAKKEKLRKIAQASFNQNSKSIKNCYKNSLNDINSDLMVIPNLISKIYYFSRKDPHSLISENNTDTAEVALSKEYNSVSLICKFRQLRNKRSEILNRANSDPETEQDFRRTCSLYESLASDYLIDIAYRNYISGYQKITSTYLIDEKANLYIYNTETENEEEKVLEFPKKLKDISWLTQLPNGELFFMCKNNYPNMSFILDRNYQIRELPFGAPEECLGAVYFNRIIYCFGANDYNRLNPSRKFDLDQNRWSGITLLRKYMCDWYFSSVIYNRNILICIGYSEEILLYSIDIDSFSKIPYSFANSKKILINAIERLYLIECDGCVYESEIGDEYDWKKLAKLKIEINLKQVYCSYNKGGIYISNLADNFRNYFKFDLNRKELIEIAFYSENFGLQRLGDKLKTIKDYGKYFKLDLSDAAIYIEKGYALYDNR